jgi:hypothetical protein
VDDGLGEAIPSPPPDKPQFAQQRARGVVEAGMDRNMVVGELVRTAKELVGSSKEYYVMTGIGHAKYVVNFHDGVKTHQDGSEFYDMEIFRNRPDMEAFIGELHRKGYREGVRPVYKASSGKTAKANDVVRTWNVRVEVVDWTEDDPEDEPAYDVNVYVDGKAVLGGTSGVFSTRMGVQRALRDATAFAEKLVRDLVRTTGGTLRG